MPIFPGSRYTDTPYQTYIPGKTTGNIDLDLFWIDTTEFNPTFMVLRSLIAPVNRTGKTEPGFKPIPFKGQTRESLRNVLYGKHIHRSKISENHFQKIKHLLR